MHKVSNSVPANEGPRIGAPNICKEIRNQQDECGIGDKKSSGMCTRCKIFSCVLATVSEAVLNMLNVRHQHKCSLSQ
jgi:hypothetical protein